MSVAVKSAVRLLQVLEYFDQVQREASVIEIARALNFPQSSTSVLLRQMHELGYLHRGADGRNYVPTVRVTLLGAWIDAALSPGGPMLKLMQEIGRATSETIMLAALQGDAVRYIHIIPATSLMRLHVGPGTVRPLAISCAGRAFMSAMTDRQVREIVFRHNQKAAASKQLSLTAVQRDLADIRRRGYSRSLGAVNPGVGGVGILLPPDASRDPLVLAIGALSATVEVHFSDWGKLLISSVRRAFPRAAALNVRRLA